MPPKMRRDGAKKCKSWRMQHAGVAVSVLTPTGWTVYTDVVHATFLLILPLSQDCRRAYFIDSNMADPVSLSDNDTAPSEQQQDTPTTDETSFAAQWQPTDTSSLHAGNLPLTRPPRAYERKPASPFTRRQIRVGKVWKRAAALPSGKATRRDMGESPTNGWGNAMRRLRGDVEVPQQSPLKAVKKRCLSPVDGGEGRVRPEVALWEGREGGGEGRKIVTRSGRVDATARNEDLVELAEEGMQGGLVDELEGSEQEEGEEEVEGTITEVMDEDGRVLEGGDGEEDGEDWADLELEEPYDMGLGPDHPLANSNSGSASSDVHDSFMSFQKDATNPPGKADSDGERPLSATNQQDTTQEPLETSNEQETLDQPPVAAQTPIESIRPVHAGVDNSTIPEGFVSPVKRAPRTSRRTVKEAMAARRRTLPVQFAAAVAPEQPTVSFAATHMPTEATIGIVEEQSPAPPKAAAEPTVNVSESLPKETHLTPDKQETTTASEVAQVETPTPSPLQPDGLVPQGAEEEVWEDISENEEQRDAAENLVDDSTYREQHLTGDTSSVGTTRDDPLGDEGPEQVTSPSSTAESTRFKSPKQNTGMGEHPTFRVRNMPRRRSSSPIKKLHTILKANEVPHLVAFSPIKRVEAYFSANDVSAHDPAGAHKWEDDTAMEDVDHESPEMASPFQRSFSAPPEEPKMSPHRPSRPRVSDDTALLQAFLSRAAANKDTKRATTARRESASNRRDSETVKQALASPAKSEVLAVLDPNSSTPRKGVGREEKIEYKPIKQTEEPTNKGGEEEISYEDAPKKRRSTRDRKKTPQDAQSTTPSHSSPPNKIAVRGRADPIVLKKTDAQELAITTRNNTRKNKGGSVLPQQRLTKLAIEVPLEAQNIPEDGKEPAANRKRGIKWDETLTYFFDNPAQPGLLELGSSDSAPQFQTESVPLSSAEDGVQQPPPPAETPSKPKSRKLKTPNPTAASAAAKAAVIAMSTPAAPEPTPISASTNAPATRQQRSRIATPASKSAATAPATESAKHIASEPTPQTTSTTTNTNTKSTQPSALPQKRRTQASKLPAPAASTTASITAVSKEASTAANASFIASPAKKRRAPPSAPAPPLNAKGIAAPKFVVPTPEPPGRSEGGSGVSGASDASGLASPAKKPSGKIGLGGEGLGGGDGGSREEGRGIRSGSSGFGLGSGLASPARRRRR